jgi:adenosylhomocysteine nucleosidase
MFLILWTKVDLSTEFACVNNYYYPCIHIFVLKEEAHMKLGIISALHEEQEGIVEAMSGSQKTVHGMRDYWSGRLNDTDTVCVLSRIGKVAAAMTAVTLVERFNITHLVFTGVAGAGNPGINVGDIVIAESLVQYDMDASPLFPRFEVPLTGVSHFPSDSRLSAVLARAAQEFVDQDFESAIDVAERHEFGLVAPRVHRGLIGSGDEFISDRTRLGALSQALPGLLAVEMEGAAVAQVCFELGVPFAVVRTISDNANEEAATHFNRIVK